VDIFINVVKIMKVKIEHILGKTRGWLKSVE